MDGACFHEKEAIRFIEMFTLLRALLVKNILLVQKQLSVVCFTPCLLLRDSIVYNHYYFYLENEIQSPVSIVDTNADIDAVDAVPVLPRVPMKVEEKQSNADLKNSRLSSLDLENKLLKNEVQSLNEELATFSTRLKEQQEGWVLFNVFI